MERKLRVLHCSDAIEMTGFARVTHALCDRLHGLFDIAVLGINARGNPHPYPYPIYPAHLGGDMWGFGRYVELVDSAKPDVVFINQDPHVVAAYLAKIVDKAKHRPKLVAYMPVDAPASITAETAEVLNKLDLAVWYTAWGQREAEAAGYEGRSIVLPHGVDRRIYRPMSKAKARKALGLDRDFGAGVPEFIVGNVNRNQPRKRLDLTVQYFAEWVRQRQPAATYLYLHCAANDVGWNLAHVAKYYGVADRLIMPAITAAKGFPEKRMREVYSAMDLQVSTTLGEGFGLSTLESMACGVPQIVPAWAALADWTDATVEYVPCTAREAFFGGGSNGIGGIADKDSFVQALDLLYLDGRERRELGERGLAQARDPRFDWDRIALTLVGELCGLVGASVSLNGADVPPETLREPDEAAASRPASLEGAAA